MNDNLDEMREQLALLKNKLDQQTILNEALLRRTLEAKLRRFSHRQRRRQAVLLIAMFYMPFSLNTMHMPLWFIVAVELFLLVAFAYDLRYKGCVTANDLSVRGLVEVHRRIERIHRMNVRWLWVSAPFLLFFLGTIVWRVGINLQLSADERRYILLGVLTGAAIGLCIGLAVYFGQQRKVKELLDDIEQLTED